VYFLFSKMSPVIKKTAVKASALRISFIS
jgi:hypothetical protein